MEQGVASAWVEAHLSPAGANLSDPATPCKHTHQHLLVCCVYRCPGTKRAMEAMTKRHVGEAHHLYSTMRAVRYLEDATTEVRWLPPG